MVLVNFFNVSKFFCNTKEEIKVLDDVTFTLKENEKISIVGPSGCGKSTILNLISSLMKKDSGEITINGKVGYMFQTDNLFEWRSIYKNILIGLEVQKKKLSDYKEKIDKLLIKYLYLKIKQVDYFLPAILFFKFF